MGNTILFVYGTLKRGERNHHLMAGQTFLREAVTMPLYRVYDFGLHPAMVLDSENGLDIVGELWSVDDAARARLDAFEEVPYPFNREDIAVRDCFETVQAYLYHGELPERVASGDRWPLQV